MKTLEIGSIKFRAEDGHELRVSYDNRGEPYREGITLLLERGYDQQAHLFLEDREAVELRDFLNKLYPPRQS